MDGAHAVHECVPQYWELLADGDKATYLQLKHDFTEAGLKRGRNTRLETFDGILDTIHHFAERSDENDWRRFLVCGVCWLDNGIAINTRQLRILVSKCKSSINGSLQKMGFTTSASHSESWKILFKHIPLLKDHFSELRQWTIRCREPPAQVPAMSLPIELAVMPSNPLQTVEAGLRGADKPPSCPLKFRGKINRAADGTGICPSLL
jgi:hypothetical protein